MNGPFEARGSQVYDAAGFVVADTAGVHLHRDYNSNIMGHWAHRPNMHAELSEEQEEANAIFIARACNAEIKRRGRATDSRKKVGGRKGLDFGRTP